MKRLKTILKVTVVIAVLVGLAVTGYLTRDSWLPLLQKEDIAAPEREPKEEAETSESVKKVILSDQAIANLGLSAKPIKPDVYWKTIQIPGMVEDRPGHSDRIIVTPVDGIVARIHHLPGETVRPGEVMFTIRLLSESAHRTQSELHQATLDTKLAQAEQRRLESIQAAIKGTELIEVKNRLARLEAVKKAYRRDLRNRGLTTEQIDDVTQGTYAGEITINVPDPAPNVLPLTTSTVVRASGKPSPPSQPTFEVEEVKIGLGQQVRAGDTLGLLANHRLLIIEGEAFPDETLLLEQSVSKGWPVRVDFQENPKAGWSALEQTFRIQHLANTIDPVKRTFAFRMPLENQSKVVESEGRSQILWRFRPGQKVRLHVRVEEMKDVFILPAEAVAREGAEAFVFTQNVNTFERKPVVLLAQDRQNAVLANDRSLLSGEFVVRKAAAQLNRMVNAGTDKGVPEGYHIHADGSLHKNEEEGK